MTARRRLISRRLQAALEAAAAGDSSRFAEGAVVPVPVHDKEDMRACLLILEQLRRPHGQPLTAPSAAAPLLP